MEQRQAAREQGHKPKGKDPQPPSATPESRAQYNFTDPESRIMKAGSGGHFEQAYNAQAAVDENMLIVGAQLSAAPNDKEQLVETWAAVPPEIKPEVNAILADNGFYSEAAVKALEEPLDQTAHAVTVYAAVERNAHHYRLEDLEQKDPAALVPEATAKGTNGPSPEDQSGPGSL